MACARLPYDVWVCMSGEYEVYAFCVGVEGDQMFLARSNSSGVDDEFTFGTSAGCLGCFEPALNLAAICSRSTM